MRIGILLITIISCLSVLQTNAADLYLADFQSKDMGFLNTLVEFEESPGTFEFASPEDRSDVVLSWWDDFLGGIFTDDFEEGRLFRVVKQSTKQKEDKTILSGIFVSSFGKYYFEGTKEGNFITAKLLDRNRKEVGSFTAKPYNGDTPLKNYTEISQEAFEVIENKIYDYKIDQNSDYQDIKEEVTATATEVHDDLEFVFAFFYRMRDLGISHLGLMRLPENNLNTEAEDQLASLEDEPANLEYKTITGRKNISRSDIGYLNIRSFSGSASEMRLLMDSIMSSPPSTLIIDLRENSGGSVEAGIAFAEYFVDHKYIGGHFLTRKWFKKYGSYREDKIKGSQLKQFGEADFDLIIKGIHEEEGLTLVIEPLAKTYQGKVYLLISGRTASTCEPIAYGLKQTKKAILIGQNTAGAMLNGEYFSISGGFTVIVPTADYYTVSGERLDQVGVVPDHVTESGKELEAALDLIHLGFTNKKTRSK